MKLIYIVILIALTYTKLCGQEYGSSFLRNFHPNDYLGEPQNWNISKDHRGIMYFANTGGLLVYDGVNWKMYKTSTNSIVRSLDVADDGIVYAGGDREFGRFLPDLYGNLNFHNFSFLLDSSARNFRDVWQTIAIKKNVYFSTFQQIFRYNIETPDTIYTIKSPTRFLFMYKSNDSLFVNIRDRGLHKIINDSLLLVNGGKKFGAKFYDGFIWDKVHYILSDASQIYFFNPYQNYSITKADTFEVFKTDVDLIFKTSTLKNIIQLSENRLFCGLNISGGVVIDKNGKIIEIVNKSTGLLSDNLLCSKLIDGILWIGLGKGIASVEVESPWRLWNYQTGCEHTVYDIVRYHDTLFVGTASGLSYFSNKLDYASGLSQGYSKLTKYLPEHSSVWSLYHDKTGDILLYGGFTGIGQISKNGNKSIEQKQNVFKIIPSIFSANLLYASTNNGILILSRKSNSWEVLRHINLKDKIRYLAEDKDSSIWVCSNNNGIYKLKFDRWQNSLPIDSFSITKYDTLNGLPQMNENKVFAYLDEIVFTTQKGIYRFNYKSDKFIPDSRFGKQFADGSCGIFRFVPEPNGNIWIRAFNGKNEWAEYLIKNQDGTYTHDTLVFKRLPSFNSYAVYPENDSIVWFGGYDGILRYNKTIKNEYNKTFNCLIRRVLINDSIIFWGNYFTIENNRYNIEENQPEKQILHFDYDYNNVTISFASPYYIASGSIRYSFILEGFDKKWSDWTLSTSKQYTNLHEGKYKFKVKAINIFGVESKIAEYRFIIKSPYYRTIWAYLFYVLVASGFIYLIVKLNTRRLELAKIKLEQTVKDRTSEIVNKNAELQQQKEEIQAQADELEQINYELEKLSIVARETDNAVAILNENGHFEWVNEGFIRFYGYSLKEIIQIFGSDVRNIALNQDITKMIELCKSTKKSITFESYALKKNGEKVYIHTTMTPLIDFNGGVYKIIAIDSNITRLKQAEVEIIQKNEEILAQKDEIENQSKKIRTQNELIRGSIRYAQTIQMAILPNINELDKYFESFVIYIPKDIVSGDFYWCFETNKFIFIALADCTGHGVPGAFMSMIGNRLLKEIVIENQVYSPKDILLNIEREIRKALHQETSENRDGMEIILCRINKSDYPKEVVCSSAGIPLIYYNSQTRSIDRYKDDCGFIGGYYSTNLPEFKNFTLEVNNEDVFILSSDGFVDQSNQTRKRFGTPKLLKILENNLQGNFSELETTLITTLDEWKLNTEQRDDITLIGLKFI